ncbi:YihY/virulence factor BrkB family protein [Silvimonas sp.]|uniref:YihY/virulence factor BrkB family protein n=1 Tax=Silvimonas sp. TaxID=2650811 RepID=UPI002840F896|nr:YihY/virulence factor BrkB family protein [Silvimonas sp.]MDR3429856.1 YihY/virulence factor BrkB family protein [Silvimonas sp.]
MLWQKLLGLWHLAQRVVSKTIDGFFDDELMTRAAALAFYSALSFAPLLVLLLWVVASLSPDYQTQLIDGLNRMVGPKAADAVQLVIRNASSRPSVGNLAGIIGLTITLIAASAVFAQLQGAINRVWGLRSRPGQAVIGWLRSRMNAVGLLLAVAFLLVISFSASTLIGLFVPGHTVAWQVVEASVSTTIFVFVFAAIFKVLPDAIIAWRDALAGAVLTDLLFILGKIGISLYIQNSDVGGAYGPAGSVVVLLVWVYYSALILLLGAELTEAVAEARGAPIRPTAHAVRILVRTQEDTPA